MDANRRPVKPGWYLLVALFLYALTVTFLYSQARGDLRETRMQLDAAREPAAPQEAQAASPGLWMPIPGASLPPDDAHLPGAERAYRNGVSHGFDFYSGQVGVPVQWGTPVIASADGVVERVDHEYRELASDEWQELLDAVATDGADAAQLDLLRGRQVWLRLDDGRMLRYAHLSEVAPTLRVGERVRRGQVIGGVGNSGTDDGVRGTRAGTRLHFEIWEGDRYFGQGLEPDQVRAEAASLLAGP